MSHQVVIDASVAIKWVLDEPNSGEASKLLERWRGEEGTELSAPALFPYEIAAILTKRMQRRELTLAQAEDRMRFFLDNGPHLSQTPEIHMQAIKLAHRFRLPTAYDAHYLAVAQLRQCDFWTADKRLRNSVKHELKWVHCLGEADE